MKTITHPIAIRLIEELLDLIPQTESGTYNKMDPTAYTKGKLNLDGILISYNDCGWGITLNITEGSTQLTVAQIYYEPNIFRDPAKLTHHDTWPPTWFKLLKLIIIPELKKRGFESKANNYQRQEQDFPESDYPDYYYGLNY